MAHTPSSVQWLEGPGSSGADSVTFAYLQPADARAPYFTTVAESPGAVVKVLWSDLNGAGSIAKPLSRLDNKQRKRRQAAAERWVTYAVSRRLEAMQRLVLGTSVAADPSVAAVEFIVMRPGIALSELRSRWQTYTAGISDAELEGMVGVVMADVCRYLVVLHTQLTACDGVDNDGGRGVVPREGIVGRILRLAHSDISPMNILVTADDGFAHLIDYGEARLVEGVDPDVVASWEHANATAGGFTPAFADPRIASSEESTAPDESVDIFALAASIEWLCEARGSTPGGLSDLLRQMRSDHVSLRPSAFDIVALCTRGFCHGEPDRYRRHWFSLIAAAAS